MFSYIKLKNFISFREVLFDLKKNSTSVKNFAAIYGENGSGKSNLIRSIRFLRQSLLSMKLKLDKDRLAIPVENMDGEALKNYIRRMKNVSNFSQSFKEFRMVECDEPTEVEYGFVYKGYEGYYRIVFTDRILEESLYWLRGKQRGNLFRITADCNENIASEFFSSLFLDKQVKAEIVREIDKYWGQHSFMSILSQYCNGKNQKFIAENLSESILSILGFFNTITVATKEPHNHGGFISPIPKGLLLRLDHGEILAKDKDVLEKTERIIRSFFIQGYADIKDVYYKTDVSSEAKVSYQLYVVKMIGGKPREISFDKESAGTQQVLDMIRALIGVFFGIIVAYDEIDNGVHDLLLRNILESLKGQITGQLIITTHNTILMQTMSPHDVYAIQVDHMGNKEIQCLAHYALQKNHNMQNLYLKGLLGGTPYIDDIDYDFIREELEVEGRSSD